MCFAKEKRCTWKNKYWASNHTRTWAPPWECPEPGATVCLAATGVVGGIWHVGTVLCSPVCLWLLTCWSQTSRSWSSVTTTELNLWWCFLSRLTDGNEYLFQAKDDVSVVFLPFITVLSVLLYHGEKQLLRAGVHSVCGWCVGPGLLRYSL